VYRDILKQALKFIFLVVLQVFVVNQMLQYNLVNPFVYPMFILLLPVNTAFWLVALLSFAMGITIDLLEFTSGIHAAALVFMGFSRMMFFKRTLAIENIEKNIIPDITNKGFAWFAIYAFLLLFLHHAVLFFLEVFTFREFVFTITKTALSALASLLLIILIDYLIMPVGKKR
jgi:rod shape-determining protein MreD